ncbi:LacI family DNA-binding transcriptional regulator [Paracoccus pacificus]|uniref:LacI family DNA-binding transcriptional regulator n=1 Tax=Paracoccus pacificus TaxID=1463598 RepID=A0ABW4R451_9RHOB
MNDEIVPKAPVRITDVARLAGVSNATVSRVLSRPALVADATRDSVMRAVAATGYRVNHAARNLRKQRTGAVVALLPNLGNPFFAKIIAAMGRELGRAGYDLLISDTQGDGARGEAARGQAMRRFLDPSRADGIVLFDGLVPPEAVSGSGPLPPVVSACEWIEGAALPRVMLDNAAGTRIAAEHLRQLGHRRIACIGGPARNVLHLTRMAGMNAALGPDGFQVFTGDFTLETGVRAAAEWRALAPDRRPTGIVAFSDEMAWGFISDLLHHGFTVPRDVSVVGFDDIELAAHLIPPLTTVRQPKREIGRLAALAILALIEGRPVADHTTLTPELIIRQSTAPPPGDRG